MPYPYFISFGGFGLRQALTIGCLVVLLLLAALPSDTPPALVIKLAPQHPNARPFFAHLLKNSSETWRNFLLGSLPWEAAWTLSPNADNTAVDSTVALSLPRLSGLVEGRADPDLWRWFPGQKVTSLSIEQPGLWVARSSLPLREEALVLLMGTYEMDAGEPLPIPEGVPCIVVMDNRRNHVYLALESILNPPRQPGDELTWKPPALDSEGWDIYLDLLLWATATAQFNDEATLVIDARIEAGYPGAAHDLLVLLDRQRDRVAKQIEVAGGWLDGAWIMEGEMITGAFSISNAYDTLPALMRGDKP